MKKHSVLRIASVVFILLFLSMQLFSQSPGKMSYQAVIRNSNDQLLKNQEVGMQISILQGSVDGTVVYSETQFPTSNLNGLVCLVIGEGTIVSGSFSSIDWSNGPFFIKTETDPTGGSAYTITSINQLLSVPYALHATTAENLTTPISENDPVFSIWDKSTGIKIKESQITDLDHFTNNDEIDPEYTTDSAFVKSGVRSWNGSLAKTIDTADTTRWGKLFTETDPLFTAWDKSSGISIKENQISDLEKFTNADETDPVYGQSIAKGITQYDTAYWNHKSNFSGNYQDLIFKPTGLSDFTNDMDFVQSASLSKYLTSEKDPVYVTDSSYLKTGTRSWNHSVAKTIDAADTTHWGIAESDPYFTAWDKHTGITITESQISDLDHFKNSDETDPGYAADSSLIKTGTRSWNSSLAKTIDSDDTTRWGKDIDATNELQVISISKDTIYLSKGGFAKLPGSTTNLNDAYQNGSTITADAGPVTITGTDGLVSTGTYLSGNNLSVNGQGVRLLWYPKKGAFRAGYVGSDQWDENNMGNCSVAMGRSTIASNYYSTALGYQTTASGSSSTALGRNSTASGATSTAMGYYSNASNSYATSFGYYTNATGEMSFASGDSSTASGLNSTAIGNHATASGLYSTAIGFQPEASGDKSVSLGANTIAIGKYSTALTFFTTAQGDYSTAMGWASVAGGKYSTAMGYYTKSSAETSTSLGNNTIADAYCSLVLGQYNTESGTTDAWVSTDPVMVIGNGNFNNRSDAFTIYKNGNVICAGTLTQNSDRRLKENIVPLGDVLNSINKITPVYYDFIDQQTHPSGRQIGFIAQELEPFFPELVSKDPKGILSVDYGKMTAVLLKAIQEQSVQIEDKSVQLKKANDKIAKLENELDELSKRVEAIESKLK